MHAKWHIFPTGGASFLDIILSCHLCTDVLEKNLNPMIQFLATTLWLFNIAMDNHHF